MQFLEALMYIWLPNDQCYMAADYTESGEELLTVILYSSNVEEHFHESDVFI